MTGLPSNDMLAQLQTLISARIPAVWLLTTEEDRAERAIAVLAADFFYKQKYCACGIWSLTGGETHAGGWDEPRGWRGRSFHRGQYPEGFEPPRLPAVFSSTEPVKQKMAATPNGGIQLAIDHALENPTTPCLLIVRDAHVFLQNDYWRRVIKDSSRLLRDTLTTVVCLGVTDDIPDDLRRDLAILRPGLPTLGALEAHVRSTLTSLGQTEIDSRECAAALRGLGVQQASDLITVDLSSHGNIDIARLSKSKARELAAVHGVHFAGEGDDFAVVGGFDRLKEWMRKRRWAFGQAARDAGIDQPKGIVLVGVPGGGKTLLGMAAAGELGLPLIVFNPSECEGGVVGETATRTAEAIRTMDALAPCVVLVDEVEKVFGGQGNLDGGSKSGMLRLLLIWLQERESDCFTMITSNDISGLPPELTRRGRVDEIWWCDLPGQRDREEILRIHLAKRNRELPAAAISNLAEKLSGYTGSEIEQVVKEAVLTAYCRKCEAEAAELPLAAHATGQLTPADLIEAADQSRRWRLPTRKSLRICAHGLKAVHGTRANPKGCTRSPLRMSWPRLGRLMRRRPPEPSCSAPTRTRSGRES